MGKKKIEELKGVSKNPPKKKLSDAEHIEICKDAIARAEKMLSDIRQGKGRIDANRQNSTS